jgi:hypothetical protein
MFFTFPEDARWNVERQAVEFGVEIGEYRGVVTIPRRTSSGTKIVEYEPLACRIADDGYVIDNNHRSGPIGCIA